MLSMSPHSLFIRLLLSCDSHWCTDTWILVLIQPPGRSALLTKSDGYGCVCFHQRYRCSFRHLLICAKCDALVPNDARVCICRVPQYATRQCRQCLHVNKESSNSVCIICNTSLLDYTLVTKRIRGAIDEFDGPAVLTGDALAAIKGYPSYEGLAQAGHTLSTVQRETDEYSAVEEKYMASINGHNSVD
jgi:hypothetical protein